MVQEDFIFIFKMFEFRDNHIKCQGQKRTPAVAYRYLFVTDRVEMHLLACIGMPEISYECMHHYIIINFDFNGLGQVFSNSTTVCRWKVK